MFPQYPDLGKRVFNKMHKLAKAKTKHLGVAAFRQQCETYLSVLDDALIHEHYVRMFMANGCATASGDQSSSQQQPAAHQHQTDDDLLLINTGGLIELLLICFRIGVTTYISSSARTDVANYSIAAETFCPHVSVTDHMFRLRTAPVYAIHICAHAAQIKRTLDSVTQSCFLTRDTLSIGFVCRWLENNLPHLIIPLHRFCVHTLTTVYRTIEAEQLAQEAAAHSSDPPPKPDTMPFNASAATGPATDAKATPDIVTGNSLPSPDSKAMALSQSWLLAAALPTVFTRLQDRKAPAKVPQAADRSEPDALVNIVAIDAAQSSEWHLSCVK